MLAASPPARLRPCLHRRCADRSKRALSRCNQVARCGIRVARNGAAARVSSVGTLDAQRRSRGVRRPQPARHGTFTEARQATYERNGYVLAHSRCHGGTHEEDFTSLRFAVDVPATRLLGFDPCGSTPPAGSRLENRQLQGSRYHHRYGRADLVRADRIRRARRLPAGDLHARARMPCERRRERRESRG